MTVSSPVLCCEMCGLVRKNDSLSPVHTSFNVEATLSNATMSNVASTLLPKRQQCRTSFALTFRRFDKVERCFDTVAQNGNIVEPNDAPETEKSFV